jgi:transcriptional regulator with XRE-family HTH domain
VTPAELRERRVALGLSQTELAELLGVTQNTVSRWEVGAHAIPLYLVLALERIEQRAAEQRAAS